MKNILKWLGGIILLITLGYTIGPKPAKPQLSIKQPVIDLTLPQLETQINKEEKAVKGLKIGNEARILWSDSTKKNKTSFAFLYLHGFSASAEEGAPIHNNLAKKYHANLYLARLSEHGIDKGDSTMINFSADAYVASAEKALAIAKQLGNEVIIIGTSAGGALTTFLASKHPEIKAIILYSPCIKIYDSNAELLDNPWGLHFGRMFTGSYCRTIQPKNATQPKYWTMHYRLEGLVGLQNFLTNAMLPSTFAKIKCPVFLGYYYKNEAEQDKVVSVPAMLAMYDELGTPPKLKEKIAFPKSGNHVIASAIMSDDWQGVEAATDTFLQRLLP